MFEAPAGEDDASVSVEEAREKKRWEDEKGTIEGVLADLKKRLEQAKESYGRTDAAFHQTSIAIERMGNQLKKNEEENSPKERGSRSPPEGEAGKAAQGGQRWMRSCGLHRARRKSWKRAMKHSGKSAKGRSLATKR